MSYLVVPATLPANRTEVTESWLIETLSLHPRFADDPIESVTINPMGEGLGQLSSLLLADVSCASSTIQLVIKLHVDVPEMHQSAMTYGHYDSEVNFYNFLADKIPLRTPEIYAAQIDRESERVLIIMESFDGWHSPNQINGASLKEVTIATESLCDLTAAFWNIPLQNEFPWVRTLQSSAYDSLPNDYNALTDATLDRLDLLPEGSAAAMRMIGANYGVLKGMLSTGHQALAHWDYRVENLFYGPCDEFAVIDWQFMMMTNPATDLAYLLSTNIDTKLRRESESELMDRFLDGLARQGVRDYNRIDLEKDFRVALLGISGIVVIGGGIFDVTNKRSHALFNAIGSRMFQTIEDWDALAMLPR
jgi:hypothetical protein